MCNRMMQKNKPIKPGERVTVLMRGPQGEFELPFTEAVFGGPAKSESRGYWIQRENAENVIVPEVTGFGEKNKTTGEQGWENLPPGFGFGGFAVTAAARQRLQVIKSGDTTRNGGSNSSTRQRSSAGCPAPARVIVPETLRL